VVGASQEVSSFLPHANAGFQILEKVLAHRMVTRGVQHVHQVLVKWSSSHESLGTWEDLEALRQQFPLAPAWGQAGSVGGGGALLAPLRRQGLVISWLHGKPVRDRADVQLETRGPRE
jgi:hypothetical protein